MTLINLHRDVRLIRQLNGGSAEAYEVIFNRYWDHMYTICYKATGDCEESNKRTQGIFKPLWERYQTLGAGAMGLVFLSSPFRKFFGHAFRASPYSYNDGLLNTTISGQ